MKISVNTRKLTEKIIVGTVAGLVAYDLYAAMNSQDGDTISEVIAESAVKSPIIAVGFGILIGHWFWSVKHVQEQRSLECGNL